MRGAFISIPIIALNCSMPLPVHFSVIFVPTMLPAIYHPGPTLPGRPIFKSLIIVVVPLLLRPSSLVAKRTDRGGCGARVNLYRFRAFQLLRGMRIEFLSDHELGTDFHKQFLEEEDYFSTLDEADIFGWFFHPDHIELAELDDYQCLVPINYGGYEYEDWDRYRLSYHTYKLDREYLDFYAEISKKIKWLERFACLDTNSPKWSGVYIRGARQVSKIVASFPNITNGLASLAYQEYVCSMHREVQRCKGLEVVFEIWKRAADRQNVEMSFTDAFMQASSKFPLHQFMMNYILWENDWLKLEEQYCSCTAGLKTTVADR